MGKLARTLGAAALAASLYAAPAMASDCKWYKPWNCIGDDAKTTQTTSIVNLTPAQVNDIAEKTSTRTVQKIKADDCLGEKCRNGKSTSKSTGKNVGTPKPEWKPRGNPDILHKEYYHDAEGAFCGTVRSAVTGQQISDAAQFYKWGLGPWQSGHNYRSEIVPAPGTPAAVASAASDLRLTGDEVRRLGYIDDGYAVLEFQYHDNLYNTKGKQVFRNIRNVKLEAPLNCDTTLDVIVCCDDESKDDKPKAPPQAETPPPGGQAPPPADSPDTPTPYTPWKNTTEVTFGWGPFQHNVSSEIYVNSRNNPRFVPYEEIFQGTKSHFGIVRSTPNTILGLQGAFANGTDHPDTGFFANCERYVDGQSIHAFGGLKAGVFYGLGGAELKNVTFGTAAGPVQFEEQSQDNVTPYAHAGLMFGGFSGNHLRLGVGGVLQEIVEQDYRVPPTNQNRGDSMTEIMPIAEIAGQRFFNNGHVKGFGNLKVMMPQTLFAENENEVIADPGQEKENRANGLAYNWRLGSQWYFTPTRPGSWYIGGEVGGMHESTDFKYVLPAGDRTTRPFDSHSMQGILNFGYRWNN